MAAPRETRDFQLIIGDSFNPPTKKTDVDYTQCKFNFIPQSLDNTASGQLKFDQRRPKLTFNGEIEFSGPPGENPKETECILIFDHDTNQVRIEKLSHTLNFTSNCKIGASKKASSMAIPTVTGKNDFKERNRKKEKVGKVKESKKNNNTNINNNINSRNQQLYENQNVHPVLPETEKELDNHNNNPIDSDNDSIDSSKGFETPNLNQIIDDIATEANLADSQPIDSTLPIMDNSDISKLMFGNQNQNNQSLPVGNSNNLSDTSDDDDDTSEIESSPADTMTNLNGPISNFLNHNQTENSIPYSGPIQVNEQQSLAPQMSVRTRKINDDLALSSSDADTSDADMM